MKKTKIIPAMLLGISLITTPVFAESITEETTVPETETVENIETEVQNNEQKDTNETENKVNNDTKIQQKNEQNNSTENQEEDTSTEKTEDVKKEKVEIPDTAFTQIITSYTGDLEAERAKRNEELTELKAQLKEIDNKLHDYDNKASELSEKMFNTQNDLKEAENIKSQQEDDMKLRIQYMYEKSNDSILSTIITSESMADALNEAAYYQSIYDYDRDKLSEYETTYKKIEDLKISIESDLAEVEKLKEETKAEQEKLEKLVEEKKEAISLLESDIMGATNYSLQSQVLSGGVDANAQTLLKIAQKAQEKALEEGTATELQVKVAQNAGNAISTFPLAYNWCAAWVSGVYNATGITPPRGNAIDYWTKWGYTGSRNPDEIPIGAAVISSGHPTYGHIGIYLGGGVVASNLGYLKIETIQSFGSTRNVCQGYQGFVGWVWPNNIDLSK